MRQLYERRLALDHRQAEAARWQQQRLLEEERQRQAALRPVQPQPQTMSSLNNNPFLPPLSSPTSTTTSSSSPSSSNRPLRLSAESKESKEKEKFLEQLSKYKQLASDEVVRRIEEPLPQQKPPRQFIDLAPTAPINDRELKKMDTQFENHLKAHPGDAEDLLQGHLQMILSIPNHPVTLKSG